MDHCWSKAARFRQPAPAAAGRATLLTRERAAMGRNAALCSNATAIRRTERCLRAWERCAVRIRVWGLDECRMECVKLQLQKVALPPTPFHDHLPPINTPCPATNPTTPHLATAKLAPAATPPKPSASKPARKARAATARRVPSSRSVSATRRRENVSKALARRANPILAPAPKTPIRLRHSLPRQSAQFRGLVPSVWQVWPRARLC